jgi:hypothetical protein
MSSFPEALEGRDLISTMNLVSVVAQPTGLTSSPVTRSATQLGSFAGLLDMSFLDDSESIVGSADI